MQPFSMTKNGALPDLENAVALGLAVAVAFALRQLSTATAWCYYRLVFLG